MSIKNVGGHAVTTVLGQSDHAVAYAAQPSFPDAPKTATPSSKKKFPPEAQ